MNSSSASVQPQSEPFLYLESSPLYRRVLLKISGEVLAGSQPYGIETATLERIASEIKQVTQIGVQLCLVIGGGNIFRGVSSDPTKLDRPTADYIGMLATVMNCLAMQAALELIGVTTRVQSAIPMAQLCELYVRRRALRHIEKGRVVLFAAGIGHPFFSTDTTAALRASEMNCDAIFKGTKVDGVYSKDPELTSQAQYYTRLNYQEVLDRQLQVMDATALTMARDNRIPITVFSIRQPNSLLATLQGRGRFTTIAD